MASFKKTTIVVLSFFFYIVSLQKTYSCNSPSSPSTPLTPSTPLIPSMPLIPSTPLTPSTPLIPSSPTGCVNPPTSSGKCPRDTLKLGICANVLGLINLKLGKPPAVPCCTLLQGLANLEAAICLCPALKANILGINLNLPINLSLLLNYCGNNVPSGFKCA